MSLSGLPGLPTHEGLVVVGQGTGAEERPRLQAAGDRLVVVAAEVAGADVGSDFQAVVLRCVFHITAHFPKKAPLGAPCL